MGMVSFAQQEVQVTQNMYNHTSVNPGYAGSNEAICATIISRNQWMGIPGNPKSSIISIDAPVYLLGTAGGVGVTIISDKLGDFNDIDLKLGYAYRTSIGAGKLGAGLQVGLINKSINFANFKATQDGDQLLSMAEKQSNMYFDIMVGAFYKIPGQLYVGLSGSQLLQTAGSYDQTSAEVNLRRHFYFTGGYEYQIPNQPSLKLVPSVFVKTDATSTQFDVNVMGKYNEKYWAGLSYRSTDAIALMIGGMPFEKEQLKPIKLGIAYDFTTSQLGSNGSSGSIELMLGYCFSLEVERQYETYRNSRFL